MTSFSSDLDEQKSSSTVALLTGGIDRHYVCALGKALAASGIALDLVGSTDMDAEMAGFENVKPIPLYGTYRPNRSLLQKLLLYASVYARLIRYAAASSPRVFHIFWEYKLPAFDRTLLLLYYKALGKKIAFTAHNVNRAKRDGVDSFWNRFTLLVQYRLVDHIFVHTKSMKEELADSFGISGSKVTVIPFGSGGMVPNSPLTPAEAKERLGIRESDRAILFFGRIARYKGLDLLVDAFERIAAQDDRYRLIIAGESTSDWAEHWREVEAKIESSAVREQILKNIRHVPDEEMETYFKAADVLALPYRQIFQSGVLFMSHSFGLPVIAADVDAFREEVSEGINGYLFRPSDTEDLTKAIERYFSSELFRTLDGRRAEIRELLRTTHSWEIVAKTTAEVYAGLSQHLPLKDRASSGRASRISLSEKSDVAEPADS
jgi:glycosyltransferase involved in cell wall biosynthesis